MKRRCHVNRWFILPLVLVAAHIATGREPSPAEAAAQALDHKLIAAVKTGTEAMTNLTYLCDEIGYRLTGSAQLKRANEWVAAKMTAYGLTNVHQEPWLLPEGWERGPANARIIEPDNGRTLSIASWGWAPGTKGKVEAQVVVVKANTSKELAAYKGKLKGAIVLMGPPVKLVPLADIDKTGSQRPGTASAPGKEAQRSLEEALAFYKERNEFLITEGAVALFIDSGKHFGLLSISGIWRDKDRPSAANRLPTISIAHNHYQMLYRLATRPAPARTRVELAVSNKFIPGPIPVWNTVGEIRGTEKPDEVVIVGAHLDSWDLGQGATDNGTGSIVVLETARALAKSGIKPKRTIRFIFFTGEEGGLHGSKAYVAQHKDELPRISVCIVHDTGTGKVIGIGAKHRPALKPLLEKELATLKELGVNEFQGNFISGSDHASFDKAGVPGLMFNQELAGYRLSHHSQADTLDRAIEANLIQGAQVMAVAALRFANLDGLLPREKPAPKKPPKEPVKEPKEPGS